MKEILFLTPGDSAPGFALTGVRQQTVTARGLGDDPAGLRRPGHRGDRCRHPAA